MPELTALPSLSNDEIASSQLCREADFGSGQLRPEWVIRLVNMPIVRAASAQDLPQILDILNREIAEGYAHFGTQPQTLMEVENEFERASDYPWTVSVDGDGYVLGFARATPWKSRGGYRQTCEIGVYVRHELHGQGVGKAIYSEFLPGLEALRFHTVLAGVALPNPASVKLHERFGFRYIGTFPEVGWKLGEWRSVGYWALTFTSTLPLS
jgi:phosphinothricin acetyltransferase